MRKHARNVKRNSSKRRTIIGLAELTYQPMVKCGGVVVRSKRKHQAALYQSMLRRKMMKILQMMKKRKSNRANSYVFVVENMGIKPQNVFLIPIFDSMQK